MTLISLTLKARILFSSYYITYPRLFCCVNYNNCYCLLTLKFLKKYRTENKICHDDASILLIDLTIEESQKLEMHERNTNYSYISYQHKN